MAKKRKEKSKKWMFKKVKEDRNPKEYKISKRAEIILSKILKEYKWNLDNEKYDDKEFDSIISHYMITSLVPNATNESEELVSEIMKHVGDSRSNIFSEYIARESENKEKNFRIIIGSCALLLMGSYGYTLQELLSIFESERWKKKIKAKEITLRISTAVRKICLYEDLDTFLIDKIKPYQPEENKEENDNAYSENV